MHHDWLVGSALVTDTTAVTQIAIEHRDADTHRFLRLSMRVERHLDRAFAEPCTHDPLDAGVLCAGADRYRRRE